MTSTDVDTPSDRATADNRSARNCPIGSSELNQSLEQRVRRIFESDSLSVADGRNRGPARSLIRLGRDAGEVLSAVSDDPLSTIEDLFAREAPLLSEKDRHRRARKLAAEILGLGPIQTLLDDPSITDVLVNGPGTVWVERDGRLEPSGISVDGPSIFRSIERLVNPLGLTADRSNPIVDARLADGARVTVVLPPLAPDGPLLAIRRHRTVSLDLSAFGPEVVVDLLRTIVERSLNVVVYGPTGSGKTSLLNAMAGELNYGERIVTVEDTAELKLPGDHVVRLEARAGLSDGAGSASIRDLVRASLRLRPDRIIVGEVRGPEAVDMIWAMSTGHRGCFSTCHASGPADTLSRLETMVLLGAGHLGAEAVRAQVRSAVDVLIGVTRDPSGSRSVCAVHTVDPGGDLKCIYSLPAR